MLEGKKESEKEIGEERSLGERCQPDRLITGKICNSHSARVCKCQT